MFKNLSIYKLAGRIPTGFGEGTAYLNGDMFTPCAPSQDKSIGWVPPRGEENGALLESVGGQWIAKLMIETKKVPSDVLNRAVAEQLKNIEAQTGRKPGKRETRELKEDARLAMLPMAFASRSVTTVWIDPKAGLLCIDSASQSKADIAISYLIRALDGITVAPIVTQESPSSAMAEWLRYQDTGWIFLIDRECELKSSDESKSVVKYGWHPLDIEEVRQHIISGKMPTKLAMTYDGRVSFVLTDTMQLRKIAFLDGVFTSSTEHEDGFDADVAIATGELSRLIPSLFEALGGVLDGAE